MIKLPIRKIRSNHIASAILMNINVGALHYSLWCLFLADRAVLVM